MKSLEQEEYNNKNDCPHCLPKERCIWCSDKYPDKDKLKIDFCEKCMSMTNHYDGECLRCKFLEEEKRK